MGEGDGYIVSNDVQMYPENICMKYVSNATRSQNSLQVIKI